MDEKEEQKKFIKNEIWMLTTREAFNRSNTYKENIKDNKKKDFKEYLKGIVEDFIDEYYHKNISEDQHLKNIEELCDLASNKYADVLRDSRLRIGIGQKILNLYLKYLWCLGEIPEPPHCPLDRTMIEKIDSKPITSWTKLNNIEEYEELMEKARKRATIESLSLAKWELKGFTRN